jgi:phosphodiesterase/alkaline phosphatase D-like protein
MAILRIRPVSRRRFLATSAATTLLAAGGGLARPLVSRANDRRSASHGVQSGEVSTNSGVVWARADRRSMSFVWPGETAGQGWGIDESRGELKLLRRATMARRAALTLKDSEDRSLWSTVIAPKGA